MPKDNSARGKGRNYDPTAAPKKRSRFGKEAAGAPARKGKPAAKFDGKPAGSRDGARAERPARAEGYRGGSAERPARTEGYRGGSAERPARDGARAERPSRNEGYRGQRDDRPARTERGERPERRSDRPWEDGRPVREPRRAGGHPARNQGAVTREPKHNSRPFDKPENPYVPVDDVVLERLEAQSIIADDASGASWSDIGIGKNIIAVLEDLGATNPFPIQVATIPDVLAGRDVLGRGRTGSGKTIAFGAPLVERLMQDGGGRKRAQGRSPRAIVLAPTRELAMQINRTIMPIAKSVGLFTTTIVGGMPQGPQVMSLRRGVDIVIATPGRLEDLQRQGHLVLDNIDIVVLDEADHMCDLGFLEPVQRVLRSLQGDVQHLLFSATLDKGVAAIIDEFLENPSVHEVAGEDQASSTIDHRVFLIDHHDKIPILTHILRGDVKAIVFARTRAFTDQLADELDDAGIDAIAIHGDLTQAKRARALERFATDRVRVLVATDVAARGIHVDDVDIVIQADAPDEYKTYLHRSGRTGRAGRSGTVVTLVPHRRARRMKEMLDRAEIEAVTTSVKQGDRHLDNLV